METERTPIATSGNKGQTLAEFALTLPVLLLLLFGIIEFGRLFQSWVTLQNAARAAARYTITGRYDDTRYPLSLIPCTASKDTLVAETLTKALYTPPDFDLVAFTARVGAATFASRYEYMGGILYIKVPVWRNPNTPSNEYLYRTWYGEDDCFPDDETEQDRKDMLRLPSIYDVARIGAAGLSLESSLTNTLPLESQAQALERYLYGSFANPALTVDTPGMFSVVVCSARARRFDTTYSQVTNNPDDTTPQDKDRRLRFYTMQDTGLHPDNPQGACVLKEEMRAISQTTGLLNQNEIPMPDAGGAGDRVTIMITYNHPLITPLQLARYVRLQANRAAVNESFKTTNAVRALGPQNQGGPPIPTLTSVAVTPSVVPNTPIVTTPDTATPELATLVPTPAPFACNKIRITPLAYMGEELVVYFENTNNEVTTLTAVNMVWDSNKVNLDFAASYVSTFTWRDTELIWYGQDRTSRTDTRVAAIYPANDTGNGVTFISPSQPFFLQGAPLDINDSPPPPTRFGATCEGLDLASVFPIGWEFGGTEFYFDNPLSSIDCRLSLQVPPPPPTPTPSPVGYVAPPSATPNCASSTMTLRFERFDPNGDVVLKLTSNRTVPSPFRGFSLVWPAWRSNALRLVSMVVSPDSGLNATLPGSGSTVWNANSGAGYRPTGVVIGQPNPPTVTTHSNTSAGTWNDNNDPYDVAYTFPPGPNSVTYIYLNFTGTGAASLTTIGVAPADFNGSRYLIECGRGNRNTNGTCSTSPCTGGPWGSNGDVGLDNQPTPAPTGPPVPTNTPGPTATPSRTPLPQTPTKTFTPPAATFTRTPAPTQGPTNTPRPSATPTSGNIGGSD